MHISVFNSVFATSVSETLSARNKTFHEIISAILKLALDVYFNNDDSLEEASTLLINMRCTLNTNTLNGLYLWDLHIAYNEIDPLIQKSNIINVNQNIDYPTIIYNILTFMGFTNFDYLNIGAVNHIFTPYIECLINFINEQHSKTVDLKITYVVFYVFNRKNNIKINIDNTDIYISTMLNSLKHIVNNIMCLSKITSSVIKHDVKERILNTLESSIEQALMMHYMIQ